MAVNKNKYDRQLRIWGEHGQTALETANICLLNCGPTGSEALKNLVLGGIGSITVVDGTKVEEPDLGNNFLVDAQSLGQSKAKCVCTLLQELNDAVSAKFVEESPETLLETNADFFSQFTLIIATQMSENGFLKLDKYCRQKEVMLIVARSYGLTGLVRISLREHAVVESKPDNIVDDLRMHKPWPELKRFVDDFDIDTQDAVVHKHIPYIIILIKLTEEWKNKNNGQLPLTYPEQKEFKALIGSKMKSLDEDNYKEAKNAAYKIWSSSGISPNLNSILNDVATEIESTSSDFWVMVAALKEYISNEGEEDLPLEGAIPDMTSLTEYYVSLQKIYHAKAEADFQAVESKVRTLLKKIGKDPDSIKSASIKNFCKNARKLSVCRYRTLEEEFVTPITAEIQKFFGNDEFKSDNQSHGRETTENMCDAVSLYILLRAADRFAESYNRYPGVFDSELEADISRLKVVANNILIEMGCSNSNVSEDLVSEMCRFGASEIHTVAAFIGGIASQEAIKLITKQFVPLLGTFVYNGIDQKCQVLKL